MQSAGEERSTGWNSSYKMYSHKMSTNIMALLFICTCSGNEEVSVVCHKHTAAIAGCAGPGKSMCQFYIQHENHAQLCSTRIYESSMSGY